MQLFRLQKENLECASEHEAVGNSRVAIRSYQYLSTKIASEVTYENSVKMLPTDYRHYKVILGERRAFVWFDYVYYYRTCTKQCTYLRLYCCSL